MFGEPFLRVVLISVDGFVTQVVERTTVTLAPKHMFGETFIRVMCVPRGGFVVLKDKVKLCSSL